MKKAIVTVVLIAILASMGWRYTSPRTRETLLGFIGMASRRAQGEDVPAAEIRRAVEDAVLPDDPAERREELVGALRRNIRELRRWEMIETEGAEAAIVAGPAAGDTRASTTVADVLMDTERIVKELEGANQDASAGTRAVERVLERLLPEKACKAE